MRITFDMPEAVAQYVDFSSQDYQLKMQELVLFDLIRQGRLSFGRAAELLGIGKIKLITDLGQMGLPYFDMTIEEVLEDAATARRFSEGKV